MTVSETHEHVAKVVQSTQNQLVAQLQQMRELPAHGMPEREEGIPRRQEEEEREPPEKRALSAHGMHGQGVPRTKPTPRGDPLSSVRPQRTACREGEYGAGTQPKGEGGAPPE